MPLIARKGKFVCTLLTIILSGSFFPTVIEVQEPRAASKKS